VLSTLLPPPPLSMRFADLLPRGRDVETLDTPKYSTPSGCHHRALPTHFELDVWRGPAGLHQEELRCRPTWACRHLSYCAYPALTPVISYPMWPRASITSTPATSSMGTSREYVVPDSRFATVFTPHQLNVLVDNSGHARIADFGLATVTQNLDSVTEHSAPAWSHHTMGCTRNLGRGAT
jgi:hypothetical protein